MSKKQEIRNKKQSKVEKDLTELTEDLKRVQADFINYKRRQEEEQVQIMAMAKQTVVSQLLPLVDNIERALNHVPKQLKNDPWAKGVAQIAKQAQSTLNAMGVEKIGAIGLPFNPELHEAVGFEDGDGEHEVVTEELRSGFKMGDQVIRPSMVKVAKVSSKKKVVKSKEE